MRPLLLCLIAAMIAPLPAQDDETPPERPAKPPVMLTFTPPDLEGEIVIGIADGKNNLVRTLRYEDGSPELKIDTNGYIAQWDGLDASGKPCPAGSYRAIGYVVGNEVTVEGVDFYFNDWMAEDQIPAKDVKLRQWGDAIGVELKTAAGAVPRQIGTDGAVSPAPETTAFTTPELVPPQLEPSPLGWAAGRDGSLWLIVDEGGQHVVVQIGKDKSSLRELRVPKDEPQPVEILAAPNEDAILLKEAGAGGVQRVRMLKRSQSQTEKDGRVVADWEVVFERTMQPFGDFGVVNGHLVADCGETRQSSLIKMDLVPNALEPGRKPMLLFAATPMHPGSAMVIGLPGGSAGITGGTIHGLPLVEVSDKGNWNRMVLGDGGSPDFSVFQGDGVVVEEFRIKNLDHIAGFDIGSFLLAAPAQ